MNKKYNLAVVGTTGMVGRKVLKVLEERQLPINDFHLFASARSAGSTIDFMGQTYTVEQLTSTCFDDKNIDIAIFSAGAGVSREFAPIAASRGIVVIDNSSAWRMLDEIPLVVPEVNPTDILNHNGIIANPNCSTIQAVVALKPLHSLFKIKRIVYSTYQSVSGAGLAGYEDLMEGIKGNNNTKKFPYPIFSNCLPHIDSFLENGYTKEELKMIEETRKIIGDQNIKITATTVRVPVFYAHSESINVEFHENFEMGEIFEALHKAPGLVVMDDPANNQYPMPIHAEDRDEVFVGRIRRDDSIDSGINMWVVADNIRKGAATNAVQIAQKLIEYWDSDRLQKNKN